jgi:hypothetical protein
MLAGPLRADLILDISPTADGKTRWVFSTIGTVTATSADEFQGRNNGNPNQRSDRSWRGDGSGAFDFTSSIKAGWTDFVGVAVTIDKVTQQADGVYLADNSKGDVFALSIGTNDVAISSGDSISWNGSVILDIPISEFREGTFRSSSFAGVPLRMNIISAVPEPSSICVLAISGAFLFRRRR